jgi:hypothetical protein
MRIAGRRFYLEWIAANALAEGAGLGTTFVVGQTLAPAMARMSTVLSTLGTAAAAIVMGVLLEGLMVGAAQARVVAKHSPASASRWVIATMIGAGVAWAVGMVPSTAMALLQDSSAGPQASAEPSPAIVFALAVGLGLITGPILGFAQWRVLRDATRRAGKWLWANALAWAVGMPIILAGMDLVPWQGSAAARVAAIYLVCLAAGAAVGAVHGLVLAHLLRDMGAGSRTSFAGRAG